MPYAKAERQGASTITGFVGGTGSGKTLSGLKFAAGLAAYLRKMGAKGNAGRVAVADTENGRAKHYAKGPSYPEGFDFDHDHLRPPFTPEAYLEKMKEAEAAGYGVWLVDSWSHSWEGEGGLTEIHDAQLEDMVERARKAALRGKYEFDEWKTRDKLSTTAWADPKRRNTKTVQRLIQSPMHIVVCLRAAEKIEFAKDGKKTIVRPSTKITGAQGWVPICERSFPFELTASVLFRQEAPGVPIKIKVMDQHRGIFKLDSGEPITTATGEAMALWASGVGPSAASSAPPAKADPAMVDKFKGWIANATTPTELKEIGEAIRKESSDLGAQLRDLYAEKQKALKGAKK